MGKTLNKRVEELILFLQSINELDLPLQIDSNLQNNLNDKTILNQCNHYSAFCRMYLIKANGAVKDEIQEQLNNSGFEIEYIKKEKYNFYIRTEKGLLLF